MTPIESDTSDVREATPSVTSPGDSPIPSLVGNVTSQPTSQDLTPQASQPSSTGTSAMSGSDTPSATKTARPATSRRKKRCAAPPTKLDGIRAQIRRIQTRELLSKERVKKRSDVRGRNSSAVVRGVAEALDCTYGEANYLVDLITHIMKEALKKGDRIHITGFGKLWPSVYKAHYHTFGPGLGLFKENRVYKPKRRTVNFDVGLPLVKMINEDYKGPDTIEECYANYKP